MGKTKEAQLHQTQIYKYFSRRTHALPWEPGRILGRSFCLVWVWMRAAWHWRWRPMRSGLTLIHKTLKRMHDNYTDNLRLFCPSFHQPNKDLSTPFCHKPVENQASHRKQSVIHSEGIIDAVTRVNTQAVHSESDDWAWSTCQFDVAAQASPWREHVEGNTHIRNTCVQLIHTLRAYTHRETITEPI